MRKRNEEFEKRNILKVKRLGFSGLRYEIIISQRARNE